MIRRVKGIVKNIRNNKMQEIEREPFNGYGFMRRVYGVEETPDIEDTQGPTQEETEIENLPKPFKHVPFNDAIE